jgi:FkbM family methyltransferase
MGIFNCGCHDDPITPIKSRKAKVVSLTTFSLSELKLSLPEALLTDPIRDMIDNGWYEIEEMRAIKNHLRPDDTFLEIGGGLGFIAALSARTIGANRVTTVEANPVMIPIIRQNLDENGFGAADVVHRAVVADATDETMPFFVPQSFWAASSSTLGMEGLHRTVSVPTISLDALLNEKQPSVLMVDVEGAEAGFFSSKLPSTLRLIVLELHPDKYPPSVIGQIFQRLGQNDFIYQPKGSQGSVVCFERIPVVSA